MKLHNTLSRQTEQFKPIKAGLVKVYSCGPTVYDYAHLGNLRAYVFDDTLRRALEANGYTVRQVMNITDVGHLSSDQDEGEDKLEKGASREHKTVWEIADYYIEAFIKDSASLNNLEPNGYNGPHGPYARATDFIEQQIAIVQILIEKGFAYRTGQAIYFEVAKLSDYGKLTGQALSDKEVGARPDVVTDSAKHHPQDFALWFFSVGRFAHHSMVWDSPWGEGFPGWHLECSAIVHATLGEPIDIHTGGVDHIGTHHTNEIAQTEAAFDVKLANYWLHNEHLLVDGEKMSKSTGNFFTLKDVSDKGYQPLALRLLYLQAHYRSQMNFTWESLEAASSFLKNLQAWADTAKQTALTAMTDADSSHLINGLKAAVAADLNTATALALINEFVDKKAPNGRVLEVIDNVLGLNLAGRSDITDAQKQIIKRRDAARAKNDWELSDKLRDNLAQQGIELNDTADGAIWRRP